MKLLPHWVLTDTLPAFFDTDSGSAIEQTAKVYGAMQTLIKEYNSFADKVNQAIDELNIETEAEINCLKECFEKMLSTHREFVNVELSKQNLKIQQAEDFMKNNIGEATVNLLEQQLSSGALSISLYYDEENEQAFIVGVNNDEELNNILNEVVDGTGV